MSRRADLDDDMPNFPWPGPRDASQIPDAALDALLAGAQTPVDWQAQPVADLVTALTAPATSDELAGEAEVLAFFRYHAGVSVPVRHSLRRRTKLISTLLTAKAAAMVAAAVVSVGGVATAAYAGALPTPIQNIAHTTIGAPAAPSAAPAALASPSASPSGSHHPGAAPGAWGLCYAYAHGTAAQKAAALPRLTALAGSASKIAGYCAALPKLAHRTGWHRGCWPFPRPSGAPTTRPSWTPTARPSGAPTAHPSWTPTARPTSLPSCPPGVHPTGPPSPLRGWPHPSGKPRPSGVPLPSAAATPKPSPSRA